MNDFNLAIPTEIIFGRKKENEIGNLLNRDSISKVLLVFGSSSIKSTGLYDKVISILSESNIEVVEYQGIQSNPLTSDVDKASTLGKRESVQAILAVGGGSVMDSAKGIAAAISMNCSVWEFYNGTEIDKALPVYNIVTLAATGSEMNPSFVLTNDSTKDKLGMGNPACMPRVSILNPELTFSVPPNYTAYGAIDVFSHIIEDYLSSSNIPMLTNRLKESLIKTVIETADLVLINPENYDARAELLWASTMALNGTTNFGITDGALPNHMLEHAVSAVHNIPHGAGLSIVIPAWMKWYKDRNEAQFKRLSKEIFNKDSVDEGIKAIENWFHSLGSPIRFSELNIEEDTFSTIADKAFIQAGKWGISDLYTKDIILEILELAK